MVSGDISANLKHRNLFMRLTRKNIAGMVAGALAIAILGAGAVKTPLYATDLGGIPSRYTAPLLEALKTWPPPIDYAAPDPSPVRLVALSVPDEEFYVGAQQVMWIEAPLSAVDKVLRDVDHYAEIFPGYEDIHIESREGSGASGSAPGSRFTTYWEQRIPVPFVANVKYHMLYVVDDTRPGRVVYRYQLKESNRLKFSDGAIVIESFGRRTRYTEYDFFNADYGIVKTLAPGRIWREALEAMFLSDAGVKLRAEHPDWKAEQVRKESERYLELYPVDKALESKKRFYKLSIKPA